MEEDGTRTTDSMDVPKVENLDPDFKEIVLQNENEEDGCGEIDFVAVGKRKTRTASKECSFFNTKHLLPRSSLRGLLPSETDSCYQKVSNNRVVVRCCIEHCYFVRNKSRTSAYNLRQLPSNEANTLQFPNESKLEQQTIDSKRLTPGREVVSVSGIDSIAESTRLRDRRAPNLHKSNSSTCSSDSEDFTFDGSHYRDYYLGGNSVGTNSENISGASDDESGNAVKRPFRNSNYKTRIKHGENVSDGFEDQNKSFIRKQLRLNKYPRGSSSRVIPKKFVSVRDLLSKIRRMQKMTKVKYDEKFPQDSDTKNPPPKLKRIIGRAKTGNDFAKMSDYFYSMPNLNKMKSKNWRVNYMYGGVQSLGIDDLLLKASELNAENFTKALGRKLDSVKSNFSEKEDSELVVAVPKTKRNSTESTQGTEIPESDQRGKAKFVKLDFHESDKRRGNDSKGTREKSPKKPGIKVKTVENINEEFKDSLEFKNTLFLDTKAKMDREVFEGRKEITLTRNLCSLKDEKYKKNEISDTLQDNQNIKNEEEKRPYIMTIVHGKSEKQRPAILRNSCYFKKRVNSTDEDSDKSKETMLSKPGTSAADSRKQEESSLEKENTSNSEAFGNKVKVVGDPQGDATTETTDKLRYQVKKKNVPFILNQTRKSRQADFSVSVSPAGISVQKKFVMQSPTPGNKLVKASGECSERLLPNDKVFKVTSIEQKLGPKETNRRFIKLVPYEPACKAGMKRMDSTPCPGDPQMQKSPEDTGKDTKVGHLLSLSTFSSILKEILPDKWFLCLDKKYGLQIIKTHMDELLNPSILISVVIARSGKLTVNVRGKQLDKSHQFYSNLCSISNSENKLSLNYVLAVLNKLRYLGVCCGCDPSLKKYFPEDGYTENQRDAQGHQVHRSHLCHLLVSLGKKRCYPCYRMNESFKKRYRREKLEVKSMESLDRSVNSSSITEEIEPNLHTRGVKRNLEEFLEESFSTMKRQISDEIERNKKLGENDNALKTQEEVLSFMGLTRKESLDNQVRKSKRKKNSFYKSQSQPVKKKIDQKELEFLEKYWGDINTLFSTSLLFGAYSRTGRSRLREKCRMFYKLLSTWRDIANQNPEWIGTEIVLPSDSPVNGNDQFDKLDVTALRAYIINSVKEVNRIKHKLRTRNSYFKILYNKFVKRRMKRPKSIGSEKKETPVSSANSTATNTPTDLSSDESSRDREKTDEDSLLLEQSVGDTATDDSNRTEQADRTKTPEDEEPNVKADVDGTKETAADTATTSATVSTVSPETETATKCDTSEPIEKTESSELSACKN